MMKWYIVLSVFAASLIPAWGEMSPEEMAQEKARMIVGRSNGSSCGPKISIESWNALNDKDRDYSGPLDMKNSIPQGGCPQKGLVDSHESFNATVREMASQFCKEQKVELRKVPLKLLNKWVQEMNTCPYGTISICPADGGVILQARYSSVDRIFTAFCYPGMKEKLTDREKKTLEICVNWICDNITFGMPMGLKLKKVHDALIDCSSSSVDHHDAMDVLLDGVGSSKAYAAASQLLLSMMCFDCRLVQGRSRKNHCWNMVKIEKNWFHLDIYRDDSLRKAKERRYDYCLLTDAEIAPGYRWDRTGVYPSTPKMAKARFYLRNELRRAWQYSKPAGETSQKQVLQKVRQAVQKRAAKNSLSIPTSGGNCSQNKKDTEYLCSSADDVNQVLEERLQQFDEDDICIKWVKGVPEWQVRQMLAQSQLPEYAEKYCVVYDEDRGKISISFKFLEHRRVLAAAQNVVLQEKLTSEEKEAVKYCRKLAELHNKVWKSKRQKVKSVYMELIMPQECMQPGSLTESRGKLSYAQNLYVICHLMKIPCQMVHGRTAEEYHSWNIVTLEKNKKYHLDAELDARQNHLSEYLCHYLLLPDSKMKKTHAWDASEFEE